LIIFIRTSKVVSKEIILFSSILLLCLLLFIGLKFYNYSQSKKLNEKEIKISSELTSLDSLRRKQALLLNDNSVFNFIKENNLSDKSGLEFLKTYYNRDSAKLIYKFMVANKLTDLNEPGFIKSI
jgi:hypothetical protein